jgi:hypothetical protein
MTNTPIKGIANARFSVTTNTDDAELIIAFADSLSISRFGERMDSLDLGDSMGVFMRIAWDDLYSGELVNLYCGDGGIQVEINLDFDSFEWEGI